MNEITRPEIRSNLKPCSTRLAQLLSCVGVFILVEGRGLAQSPATETEKNSSVPSATASKLASTDSKRGAPDAPSLAGRSAGEVEAALGKPSGKLQNAQGALWLYSQWRVQFDHNNHVLLVEKDLPVTLSKLDPQFVANANAVTKGANERAAADDAARVKAAALGDERIRVVSNGGEQVNLGSLMTPGKITIVDFYADWCGPCRRISPQLEQLAKTNPDVVLLKIDIVNWNTPVTRQFGIQSVPNVRVFSRIGTQLGDATSDVGLVKQRVEQAKRS